MDSSTRNADPVLRRPPRAGDGTLHESKDSERGNWFGPSNEPQEEFINDATERPEPPHVFEPPTAGPEIMRPSELPDGPTVPPAEVPGKCDPATPPEIFPYGDPGEQTDG